MQETIGTFELIIGGSILIFIMSGFFVLLYYHYSRRIVLNKLHQNHLVLEHQKALLKNELLTIEKERKRIARDLHDEIGANLAYVGMHLGQIAKDCQPNLELTDKIEVCQNQLNKTIGDVRRISHDLLPPILDMFGLVPSFQEFFDRLDSSFEVDYTYDESFNQLSSDVSLQLYRIILELINNSVKHSQGSQIHLKLKDNGPTKEVVYSDNGIGYRFDEMCAKSGLGLKNIVARLDAIGAKYHFDTQQKSGFFMNIILNENTWQATP
jgi:two-component system, NarL family, sensor kinase